MEKDKIDRDNDPTAAPRKPVVARATVEKQVVDEPAPAPRVQNGPPPVLAQVDDDDDDVMDQNPRNAPVVPAVGVVPPPPQQALLPVHLPATNPGRNQFIDNKNELVPYPSEIKTRCTGDWFRQVLMNFGKGRLVFKINSSDNNSPHYEYDITNGIIERGKETYVMIQRMHGPPGVV